MCILIVKPASETIPEHVLRNCQENNSDGCGFAYVNTDHLGNRSIVIKKSMDFETFLRQYNRASRTAPDSTFLIHFRIATHGEVSTFNCHPFQIDDNHCFGHNGVISGLRVDARLSDTQVFNEEIFKKLPEGWMKNSAITELIESRISYNKIAVLNIDGDVQIYNAHKGEMVGKCWFSNSTYKKRTYVTHSYVKPTVTAATVPVTVTSNSNVSKLPFHSKGNVLRTEESYLDCDDCGIKIRKLKDQFQYYDNGSCFTYCDHCSKKVNKKIAIDTDTYLDWINSTGKEMYDSEYTFFKAWINPWMSQIDYSDTDSLDDERFNAYGVPAN